MAIKAFGGGISQQPLPDFNLTSDIQGGDILVFDDNVKAFINTSLAEFRLLGGFATKQYVDELVSGIPTGTGGTVNLSGYVTDTELATQLQTINNLLAQKATTAYVDQQIAQIPSIDLSGYLTVNSFNSAIANYETASDVNSKITLALQNYDLGVTVDQKIANAVAGVNTFSGNYNDLTNKPTIPDVTGYATEAWVTQQIANIQTGNVDLSNYVTQADLTTALSNYQPTVDLTAYALKTELFDGDYSSLTNTPTIPDITGLASETYVQQQLAGYQPTIDLSAYYTKAEVDALITPHFSGNYNDLTNKPTLFSGSYNDLTDTPTIPDITGLATTAYVDQEISNITHPTAGLATTAYVDQQIATVSSGGTIDLTGYVTDADLQTALSGVQANMDPWSVNQDGAFIPDADITYDIGTPTNRVRDIYMSGSTLYFDTDTLTRDTNGDLRWKGNDIRDYSQLKNKPDLTGLDNLLDTDVNNVNRPVTYTALDAQLEPYITDAELALALLNAGIFSGDYNDLLNKPTIPGPQTLALNGNVLSISDGNSVDLTTVVGSGTGSVDLTGYATQTYVQQQISGATLGAIANLNDLNDVAIDGTETTNHVLMYNALDAMWNNVDLDESFATKEYVTQQLTAFSTDGTIDLEGYATESYVTQKLLERGDHFSGNYNDLVNRPTLFSGDYNDLLNKPAGANDLELQLIGSSLRLVDTATNPDTTVSTLDLSSIASSLDYSQLSNLPDLFSGNYNDLVNRPTLFSGNYNDLANKPYIPSIAGLATETYVDNKHAEPNITGDRFFTHDVEFQKSTSIVAKVSTLVAASHDNYVMSIVTTDNVVTEALLAAGNRVELENNSTVMYEVHVVGGNDTHKYGVRLKGIADNTNGTVSLIGSPSRETITDNEYAWTANVEADQANSSLRITVKGSESTNVNWTVFVEINAVKR